MLENKKIMAILLISMLTSCSSHMTICKVNRPAKDNFRKELKEELIFNKPFLAEDPSLKKYIIDKENYFFNNSIKNRNKVIDSLGLLNKEMFLIIDEQADLNGIRAQGSYFFYDNKIIDAGYYANPTMNNGKLEYNHKPYIKETSEEILKKNYNYFILEIKEKFKNVNSDDELPEISGGNQRRSFLVTVVKNNTVRYYSVKGLEEFKVVKLN